VPNATIVVLSLCGRVWYYWHCDCVCVCVCVCHADADTAVLPPPSTDDNQAARRQSWDFDLGAVRLGPQAETHMCVPLPQDHAVDCMHVGEVGLRKHRLCPPTLETFGVHTVSVSREDPSLHEH
jgi:hypothetical protein